MSDSNVYSSKWRNIEKAAKGEESVNGEEKIEQCDICCESLSPASMTQ